MTLSDFHIKKLAPKKARFELSDGKGLSLRVMPTGKKTWVYRYMIEGKARRMTLGTYPALSLSGAREKHSLAMQDVESGIDPGLEKKRTKAKRKSAPNITDLFEEFWTEELQHKKSSHNQKGLLFKDVLPAWGELKVVDITRRDAVLLIDGVRKRAPVTANRLQSLLVRMFNFAAERGVLEHSPLIGMKKKSEKPRSRVLTNDEIRLLWDAIDLNSTTTDIHHVSRLALKMILLTGQRPGEVAGMRWDEIDTEGFWNIPPARRKTNEAQRLPLCDMAMAVIEQARMYSGKSPFVFASPVKEDVHVRVQTISRSVIRNCIRFGIEEKFTPHDLRRTVRTRLADIGIDDVVAERILGHKLQGIMAVYNRHGYDAEKRQALDKWERKLRKILEIEEETSSKVIQFSRFAKG